MRAAGHTFGNVGMLARLTRDLPGFLRARPTLEQAEAVVRRRLERRPERFLRMVERAIYGQPRSPYRRLLRAAGCKAGDLRALVAREGVEGALTELAERGVYVSFDEFKGRREVVHGSERFTPAEEDFDNPRPAPHFEVQSGGNRSRGTAVKSRWLSSASWPPTPPWRCTRTGSPRPTTPSG